MKKQQPYHAYLLRCWRESDASSDTHTWRFSLEGVQKSQRHGFADLQSLLAFLQQITQPTAKKMSQTCHGKHWKQHVPQRTN